MSLSLQQNRMLQGRKIGQPSSGKLTVAPVLIGLASLARRRQRVPRAAAPEATKEEETFEVSRALASVGIQLHWITPMQRSLGLPAFCLIASTMHARCHLNTGCGM